MSVLTAGTIMAQNTGLKPENMDLSKKPGTDFYEYACGGWMKANPLTAEYSRYGAFDVLRENNTTRLNSIIESCAKGNNAKGSIADKIAVIYNQTMDSAKLNREGYTPVKPQMEMIAGIKDKAQYQKVMASLGRMGIGTMFTLYVAPDEKNASQNILQIYQGGLTLGSKDYYVENDEATVKVRNEYKKYIAQMFQKYGFSKSASQKAVKSIMAIETAIARASKSNTELRDPEGNYNKMSIAELNKTFPTIKWSIVLAELSLTPAKEVVVGQPDAIHGVEQVLAKQNLESLKTYLMWRLMNASADCLSDGIRQTSFKFFGTVMSGQTQERPRWKRAVSAVESALGEAVGQLYVEKYFPAEAKARMQKLIHNLQVALAERIMEQKWMSSETKTKAMQKLLGFYVKVGYPDKWTDYSKLSLENDNLWNNSIRTNQWSWDKMVSENLNKPVNIDEWQMTPQTVNAYYNPTTNEICFPAGILQYPFFDMNADDAFNYGAIGVVIGHEMTHGFDDQGSQYDKDGNLSGWWTKDDREKFNALTDVMDKFFSNIEVLPGLNGNGRLTLGENLADHGGLQVSFQAFKNATKNAPLKTENGFTPEQRFFLAYAGVWGQNIRDEEIRKRTKSDPHSLGRWRVNGALPHIDAWYEAFGINASDPMFVPKDKRVNVW